MPGVYKLAAFSIEANKDTSQSNKCNQDKSNHEKLQFRLWANMLIATVESFMQNIQKMTVADFINLKQLEGYGLTLTGDGTTGVYKLLLSFGANEFEENNEGIELDPNSSTSFVEKVRLLTRDRPHAAEILNFTLKHCLNSKQ